MFDLDEIKQRSESRSYQLGKILYEPRSHALRGNA